MNHGPDSKELRNFGLLVGGVFSVIGLWPMVLRGEPLRLWAVTTGALLIILGSLTPKWLAPIHRGWMWVGGLWERQPAVRFMNPAPILICE